jgi:hypothetical protein
MENAFSATSQRRTVCHIFFSWFFFVVPLHCARATRHSRGGFQLQNHKHKSDGSWHPKDLPKSCLLDFGVVETELQSPELIGHPHGLGD